MSLRRVGSFFLTKSSVIFMSENETNFCYLIANADAEMPTDISKLNNRCPAKSCK